MYIVVADSSRLIREYVSKQILERGNTLIEFSNGLEVYDYITSKKPMDILLTSLELPEVSGLELCWEANVRSMDGEPNYTIVMSSSSNLETLVEALDSGADDFLKKPFVKEELHARLRAAERTVSAQRELMRLANNDNLTNISNRRDFFNKIDKSLFNSTKREDSSMIILDLDDFKRINDAYGYKFGDKFLVAIAQAVAQEHQILGRLSGGQFGVYLPQTTEEQAYAFAEKIRKNISNIQIKFDNKSVSVTVSVGVYTSKKKEGSEAIACFTSQALNAAKYSGHNHTVVWGSLEHQASVETTSSVQGYDHLQEKTADLSSHLRALQP